MVPERLPPAVRSAVLQHLLITGLVAAALSALVASGVWVVAQQEGHRTAQLVSGRAADALAVPLSAIDYRDPDPAQRAALVADLDPFLRSDMIHRLKVWLVEGDTNRVVFSDEPRIEGESRPFPPDLARRLAAGETVSLPLPDDDEHRFEVAADEPLIEVFRDFTDAAGNPVRLEVYVPVDVAAATGHTMAVLLPVTLGGLLLLGAATVPLTISLARRMERERHERRAALHYGLAASDRERSDLAQQLHDGVIQDLAGAGMLLHAIRLAEHDPAADATHRQLLDEAHRLVEDDVRQLRDLATDLLPATLAATDLRTAITDLVTQLGAGDAAVAIEVGDGDGLPDDAAVLLHRVARELLRNAFRHSGAARIDLQVTSGEPDLVLTVRDDGVGFDPRGVPDAGHIGLQLVRRAVEEVGGRLTLVSAPGAGTTVRARFPVRRPVPAPGRPRR